MLLFKVLAAAPNADVPRQRLSSIWKVKNLWVMKIHDSTAIAVLCYDPVESLFYVKYKSSPKTYYVYSGLSVKNFLRISVAKSKGSVISQTRDELELEYILTITKVEM